VETKSAIKSWGFGPSSFINPYKSHYKPMKTKIVIAALSLMLAVCILGSCNVTRTVTTTAQTVQRGDTTTTITTRTVEQYDAKVDASKLLQAGSIMP
jgi:hypothetical protein